MLSLASVYLLNSFQAPLHERCLHLLPDGARPCLLKLHAARCSGRLPLQRCRYRQDEQSRAPAAAWVLEAGMGLHETTCGSSSYCQSVLKGCRFLNWASGHQKDALLLQSGRMHLSVCNMVMSVPVTEWQLQTQGRLLVDCSGYQ